MPPVRMSLPGLGIAAPVLVAALMLAACGDADLPERAAPGASAHASTSPAAPPASPDERSALTLPDAAPGALAPPEYASAHHAALLPDAEGWREAMAMLAREGDAFTLTHLERPDRDALSHEARAVLTATEGALKARLPLATPAFCAALPAMLARAAWVDLMCDPLESTLPGFTKSAIAARLGDREVRAALEQLRDTYTHDGEDRVGYGSMSGRVRDDAEGILAAGA